MYSISHNSTPSPFITIKQIWTLDPLGARMLWVNEWLRRYQEWRDAANLNKYQVLIHPYYYEWFCKGKKWPLHLQCHVKNIIGGLHALSSVCWARSASWPRNHMWFRWGGAGQRYLCHGRALLTSLLLLSSFSDTFLARLFQSSHVVAGQWGHFWFCNLL